MVTFIDSCRCKHSMYLPCLVIDSLPLLNHYISAMPLCSHSEGFTLFGAANSVINLLVS
jgi:hypothetical protein